MTAVSVYIGRVGRYPKGSGDSIARSDNRPRHRIIESGSDLFDGEAVAVGVPHADCLSSLEGGTDVGYGI